MELTITNNKVTVKAIMKLVHIQLLVTTPSVQSFKKTSLVVLDKLHRQFILSTD